jgi:colanic acid/amylovoran biosynthesis glycosyltransferase
MRALFCLNGPNELNGPNVWLTRQLPRLRGHGIEPCVLYLALDPEEPCQFRASLAHDGIPVRAVRMSGITEDDVRAMLEAINAERPALFVPNYSAAGYFACHLTRAAGIRTIGILHSDDPYYQDIADWFVSGPEPWRLDGVVTVSDYLYETTRRRALPPTRVMLAPCGTPLPQTVAAPPDGWLTLIYVGRLVERQKRILRLADRLCAAASGIPGVSAVMYGDGDKRADVEALIEARAPGRVRVESRSPDAMLDAIAHGHALVLLSDYEGLSIAVMEAMACGVVPIVSHTQSGIDDLVMHEINGLIVDPDCERAFLSAVQRLRDEPGLWTRLSTAARQTIVDRGYTADECAKRWAEFCKRLAPQSGIRAIDIPAADDLELPPECQRAHGLRVSDWRRPWQRLMTSHRWERPIYVWGAGRAGQLFLTSPIGRRVTITGVIDSRVREDAAVIEGIAIHPPETLRQDLRAGRRPFVIIASMQAEAIGNDLQAMGLEAERDFNLAGCWA